MKYTFLSFLIIFAFFFVSIKTEAQNANPIVITQVRALLNSKGLNENDVKSRLKSKGLDVDKMSQEELVKNRAAIEQTISEMEAEKNAGKTSNQAQIGVQEGKNLAIAPQNNLNLVAGDSVPVSTKEIISDKMQESVATILPNSPIYGHKIFREKSIEVYRVSKDASPPETYILAPGDKINVLIFGRSQADLSYEINTAGFIQPNLMPKIFLSGLTLKQAKDLLIARFSNFYVFNKDQFALTLNTSRTLSINIFGEVEKAGTYTTSALNTALNALSVSGGPTDFGTVRKIQIIRGNTKKILDVYQFLSDPTVQFDFFLQNNDIIFVPPAEKIITIEGAVNRPMKYELKEGEGLKELIGFSGGVNVNAYTELVQVQRYNNNKIELIDYALSDVLSGKTQFELKNGDIVRLKNINSPLKNFVRVKGAGDYEGDYDLLTTGTLKTLLQKAKIKPEAKKEQAFINRKRLDQSIELISFSIEDVLTGKKPDIVLQQEDELLIFEQARYIDQFSISVAGEVRAPFSRNFRYGEFITIQEALDLAGGVTTASADFAYIYRTDPFQAKKTEYIPIQLKTSSQEKLLPGDRLILLNKFGYQLESSVSIAGDVNKPSVLRFDSTLSIKDLILLGGGFTLSSNPQYVEIFRLKFEVGKPPTRELIKVDIDNNLTPLSNDFALSPFDVVVIRKTPEFSLQETVSISGEVQKEGPFVLESKKYHFSDLIEDAGGFNRYADIYNTSLIRYEGNKGIIAFNAEDAIRFKKDESKDPVLAVGDFIRVPRLDNIVTISPFGTNYLLAESQREINITFQGVASARWYVRKFAGGFENREDKKYFRVIRQNGMQEATKEWLIFRKHPKVRSGDKIVLTYQTKEEREKTKREVKPLDWDKVVSRLLALFSTLALIQAYVK